jgi:hypothetical protein
MSFLLTVGECVLGFLTSNFLYVDTLILLVLTVGECVLMVNLP